MKNIQVIDGAENCVFDIFAATEDEFRLIFPPGEDVAFIDEVYKRSSAQGLEVALARIWNRRIPKSDAIGIHGVLYYGLEHKKAYNPTRRDEEAVNPDGTRLRRGKPQPLSSGLEWTRDGASCFDLESLAGGGSRCG